MNMNVNMHINMHVNIYVFIWTHAYYTHMLYIYVCVQACVLILSHIWLFVTSWTIAWQTLLSRIFQTRTLERVAISYSRGSSSPWDWTHNSFLHWQVDSLPLSHLRSPCICKHAYYTYMYMHIIQAQFYTYKNICTDNFLGTYSDLLVNLVPVIYLYFYILVCYSEFNSVSAEYLGISFTYDI